MEEIKVGEYVRTKQGIIGKVLEIDDIFAYLDREVKYIEETETTIDYTHKISITKHSPNIIDLIEVGDYVNGNYVIGTGDRINDYNETVILTENYDEWTNDGIVTNKEIKEVVTHEQFNFIKYVIGE